MNTRLFNIFVYDSHIPEVEGSEIPVFYYFPEPKTEQESFRTDIEVGLSIAFLGFCQRFGQGECCDYIYTNKREIVIYGIGDGVFISASLVTDKPKHRLLLKSVLTNISSCLNFLIGTLHRNPDGTIDKLWVSSLRNTLPKILEVFSWDDIIYDQIWPSYIPSVDKGIVKDEIGNLLQEFPFIKTLIATQSGKVIDFGGNPPLTPVDTEMIKILTYLVHNKFSLFFKTPTKKIDNQLHWVIGFIRKNNIIVDFYTPPVYIHGSIWPLAVLRFNKYRFILLFDPKIDPNFLNEFANHLIPIVLKMERLKTKQIKAPSYKNVELRLKHIKSSQEMEITSHKIQTYDFNHLEHGLLLANEFNSRVSEGTFPLDEDFHGYFFHDDSRDVFVVSQFQHKGLSSTMSTLKDFAMCD